MPLIKTVRAEEVLTEEEVAGMIRRAELLFPGKAGMVKCLVAVLWLFGKRVSEVLRLKRKDVWSDERFLYVRFTVLKKKKPYKAVKKVTVRNPFVKHVLEHAYNIEEPEAWLFPGYSKPKTVKVKARLKDGTVKVYTYERAEAGVMSRQQAYHIIKRLNPNVWLHLFRHSVATHYAVEGATPFELQAWFDWERLETAARYVRRGTHFIENMAQRTW